LRSVGRGNSDFLLNAESEFQYVLHP